MVLCVVVCVVALVVSCVVLFLLCVCVWPVSLSIWSSGARRPGPASSPSLFCISHIFQLTPQQQSAEPRNSAGAEALAVARRPKAASREKTRPPPVSRGSSPIRSSIEEKSSLFRFFSVSCSSSSLLCTHATHGPARRAQSRDFFFRRLRSGRAARDHHFFF